ncbi:MAG: hypothetical protein ACOC3T_02840 [Bacteroidota bacterium]
MKVNEFIIQGINKLVELFPQTRISYQFDEIASTHYIQIQPSEIYKEDQQYIAWEKKFYFDFIHNYPDQNICFITDDAPFELDDVNYDVMGSEYGPLIKSVH